MQKLGLPASQSVKGRNRTLMQSTLFPKPKLALENEYRRICNQKNLKYVFYFSILCCAVFAFHLLHHFRLGMMALSAEMIPYTLIYSFAIIYSGLNVFLLSRLQNVPALTPVAAFIELAFPFFVSCIALILSVIGAQIGQGITPFAVLVLSMCFMIHGQFKLILGLVLVCWAAMLLLLLYLMGAADASPHIAIGFTTSLVSLVVANVTENSRIEQFQIHYDLSTNNKKLRQLSSEDPLTGLLNRRSFDSVLEREMSRSERFGHPLSLLIIDVDNFKSINDTFGHVFGDDVIKNVAESIKKHVRDVDLVGRLGGDEFIVILIETGKSYAIQVADRMRIEVAKLPLVDGMKPLSISVGHAQFNGESLTALIERADKALYLAKKAGKNRVRSSLTNSS